MTQVFAVPEIMTAAAVDVASIGSSLRAANAAASASTTSLAAAAGDEVSAAIALLFSEEGRAYQALSARAAAFEAQFMQALRQAGLSYAAADAASVSPLQTFEDGVLAVINAPTNLLLGTPLIGKGSSGAPGTGQNGGPGGILWG
ncbi:PE family protein, partial [Mycobacterium asiaticum]|uniref:PE family protein n=1 Tax=Mycobacterium asiaticum TaxID=1790 RepID=UPI000A7C574B